MEPIAQIDDLITIEGYGDRVFRVDGYTREDIVNRDFVDEDILYDCHCVVTAEYMLGGQDDIEVVCKAVHAEEYLHYYDMAAYNTPLFDFPAIPIQFTEVGEMFKPITPKVEKKAKEPTKQERIDELLDLRIETSKLSGFESEESEAAYK